MLVGGRSAWILSFVGEVQDGISSEFSFSGSRDILVSSPAARMDSRAHGLTVWAKAKDPVRQLPPTQGRFPQRAPS